MRTQPSGIALNNYLCVNVKPTGFFIKERVGGKKSTFRLMMVPLKEYVEYSAKRRVRVMDHLLCQILVK